MTNKTTGSIEITYYTDPLCCWSWGFEPQWRKLRYQLRNHISFRYCMGGLIPDWKRYHDSINDVSRPAQMAPVWHHAGQVTGMPIETKLWMQNPPQSSYPACIAVKCAALQSAKAGDIYLRALREAAMLLSKNIADQNVLLEVASNLAATKLLDEAQFANELQNGNGLNAFKTDLKEVQYYTINRFPTLIFRQQNQQPLIISGYKPYVVVAHTIKKLLGDAAELNEPIDADTYQSYWGSITERELQEVTQQQVTQ